MVNIDYASTKDMLENTSHDFLVHKGSYDRLYSILKNKSIGWREFASFSDGIPLVPLHGDTVIIFDKKQLIKKGHHFLKINYDLNFLNQNKDVLAHIMENKNQEELLKEILKSADESEKKLRILLRTAKHEDKKDIFAHLKMLQQARKTAESNPMRYLLKIFEAEKEIVSKAPFNFDSEDVKCVISSVLMPKYYGVPKEFKDRFLLLEDYCRAGIVGPSPLSDWLDGKTEELKKMGIIPIDEVIFKAFHIINGIIINPDWETYVKTRSMEIYIPKKWNPILRNMHKSPNDALKMDVIDYIFRAYITRQGVPQEDYEAYLHEKISKVVKPT